jgi:hypothetical protein
MKKIIAGCLLAASLTVSAAFGAGFGVKNGTEFDLTPPLAKVTYKSGKTAELTVGVGSGLYHSPYDEANIVYSVTDRGPNIDCPVTEKLTGSVLCEKGKVFPVPSFVPSIYKIKITEKGAEILEIIPMKDSSGKKISGISNPLAAADTENSYDVNGAELTLDPAGVDTEAIVKLKDGSFWLADEYGPSIIHVAPDGVILSRYVPVGLEADYKKAGYPVYGTLPAVLMKRHLNRGAESIAVSPDEKFIYFAMQSPLDNPSAAAYKASTSVRIFKADAATGKPAGEYIYEIDSPETFAADNVKKTQKQSDVKVSEMAALGMDRLLVLERISKTTKFYIVELKSGENILGSKWDAAASENTLELMKNSEAAGIRPLSKKIAYNSDTDGELTDKIEGMALMGGKTVVLINDSDFGIAGDGTKIKVVEMNIR